MDFSARALSLAAAPALPSRGELAAEVAAAAAALASVPAAVRPRDGADRPGGLVELPGVPTVLVPDIHARPDFLASALLWKPPGRSRRLASLLERGEACLVCLGDVFHSEWGRARQRWTAAYQEYASGWAGRAAMDEEMALSLAALRIVLGAEAAYPGRLFYLKGNHDNIADEEGRGDHPFYKFVAEGEMVASWFVVTYGEELLWAYRALELELPLVAVGSHFVASHAEPAFGLAREEVVEYRSHPELVESLIWTANDEALPGSVDLSLRSLLGPERSRGALWFAGHRPVSGRFALRAGGRFVQFHDPGARRVAFLEPGRLPDPRRDILDVAGDIVAGD